jgi:hypothetical protein
MATPAPDALALEALEAGLAAFRARDTHAAHQAFERGHRRAARYPALMSWYGVTLVLVEKNSNLGVSLCDQAIRLAGPDPELVLNQARVHLALNQRERCMRAVARGLELWPQHAGLAAARDALGQRSSPVLPFLARKNPLNKLFGRLRHGWRRRNGPVYELSALALGFPSEDVGDTAP